jgi:hypothetical protein
MILSSHHRQRLVRIHLIRQGDPQLQRQINLVIDQRRIGRNMGQGGRSDVEGAPGVESRSPFPYAVRTTLRWAGCLVFTSFANYI